MFSKIFSFTSLIVSITAFVISGAYYVYRVENRLSLFPAILLLVTTFSMVIICTFNYYNGVMSVDCDNISTDESDDSNND